MTRGDDPGDTAAPAGRRDHADDPPAEMFRRFGVAVRQPSPLYARLSDAGATRPHLAELLDLAPHTQRNPPLLFAAVHWLLLRGADHDLADDYPSVRRRRGRAMPGGTPRSRPGWPTGSTTSSPANAT